MKRSEIRETRSDDGWRILQCMQLAVRPGLRFASSGLRNCKGKPGKDGCGDGGVSRETGDGPRCTICFQSLQNRPPTLPRKRERGQTESSLEGDRKAAQLTTPTLETSFAGQLRCRLPLPLAGEAGVGPGWGLSTGADRIDPDRLERDDSRQV